MSTERSLNASSQKAGVLHRLALMYFLSLLSSRLLNFPCASMVPVSQSYSLLFYPALHRSLELNVLFYCTSKMPSYRRVGKKAALDHPIASCVDLAKPNIAELQKLYL